MVTTLKERKEVKMAKKTNFTITWQELAFVISIALLGFLFSSKGILVFLDEMPVIVGFAIYEIILYGYLFLMSRIGILTWHKKKLNALQVFGAFLITSSFFLVVNLENPYVQYETRGSFTTASNVYFGTEDGITWSLWSAIFPTTTAINILIDRILTFIITPIILSLAGVYLVEKIQINP